MKVKPNNYIAIEFPSRSVNEGLARAAVAAFAAQLDPTLDELGDIKTAVSEAVTNAIVHAYPQEIGKIALRACIFDGNLLEITVRDWGCGIADVEKRESRSTRLAVKSAAAWALRSWRALWIRSLCARKTARARS